MCLLGRGATRWVNYSEIPSVGHRAQPARSADLGTYSCRRFLLSIFFIMCRNAPRPLHVVDTLCCRYPSLRLRVSLRKRANQHARASINPCDERELDLRGYKIPMIENLGVRS